MILLQTAAEKGEQTEAEAAGWSGSESTFHCPMPPCLALACCHMAGGTLLPT